MKLTMLGTGKAFVTECYNTCFVLSEDSQHFMVDGGGGNAVLRQLKYAGLDWMNINEIFITHRHMDHLLGIMWMIRKICNSMNIGEYKGEVNIYGHEEVISLVRSIAAGLLHEAFCLYSQIDMFHPYEKHHSTVKDACELAERLNVANLLLYHTEDKNIVRRKELYIAEGKQYFSGNLFVPDDLETLVV